MGFSLGEPAKYVGSIVTTFLGGFLAAHLLLRVSRLRKANKDVDESSSECAYMGFSGQTDSNKTESSCFSPATPGGRDVRQVAFASELPCQATEDDEDEVRAPQSAFSAAAAQSKPYCTDRRQNRNPLQLGVLPSPKENAASTASLLTEAERSVDLGMGRAPSGIPTEIHLPELVFGDQIAGGGGSRKRPPVLPFSTYAPCRLLDVPPDSPENGHIFEGLRTIAAYYLRADSPSICECIQTFCLNDLLFSIARLECSFKKTLQSGHRPGGYRHSMIAKAAEHAVGQKELAGPKRADEVEAVRGVVAALMHELECILHEYLSFNWDRVDEIYNANKHLLREEGLVCAWKSVACLASLPSTPSLAGTSPQKWDLDSNTSGSYNNLTELDQPSTPNSENNGLYETFDEYLAKKVHSRTGSTIDGVQKQLENLGKGEVESESEQNPWQPESTTTGDENGARRSSSAAAGPSGRGSTNSRRGSPSNWAGSARKQHSRAVRNWKRAKAAVTRKITEDMLGPQRRFLTLRQMFEDLNRVPDHSAPSQRQPIILLLGGGMAAGKSTVREIIGRDGFWTKVGKDAVVVEADAIKNRDILYRSLTRLDLLSKDTELRQHLHEYSTKAAEALLVAAVNQQKDVVFDGTMTWAPFVQQTIAMVRDHRHNYKRGPGFFVDAEGNTFERYWEIDDDSPVDVTRKRPYRIELVGVTCDTGLAVARGIWRKIRTGRSVPVPSQLRSHRLFAENFETFANLVDSATLYHTGSALTTFNKGGVDLSPTVIAHRSPYTRGELLINPTAYKSFKYKVHIIDSATCRHDLYEAGEPCDGKVPTTQEDQMSTLRHVFRAADRRERKALRKKPIPRRNSFW